MTTKTMTTDQFAKFIAGVIQEIEFYSFDVMYDIKKIVTELNEYRGNSDNPIYSTYHLMVRNTGCDMVEPDSENYSAYDDRTSIIYSLRFCWNTSYFNNSTSFCEVTQIR